MVDEELRATVEQLDERPSAVAGVEAVPLLDGDPGELASLPGEVVAHPRVLFLEAQQLISNRR